MIFLEVFGQLSNLKFVVVAMYRTLQAFGKEKRNKNLSHSSKSCYDGSGRVSFGFPALDNLQSMFGDNRNQTDSSENSLRSIASNCWTLS